jgi:hypothetical protein
MEEVMAEAVDTVVSQTMETTGHQAPVLEVVGVLHHTHPHTPEVPVVAHQEGGVAEGVEVVDQGWVSAINHTKEHDKEYWLRSKNHLTKNL